MGIEIIKSAGHFSRRCPKILTADERRKKRRSAQISGEIIPDTLKIFDLISVNQRGILARRCTQILTADERRKKRRSALISGKIFIKI